VALLATEAWAQSKPVKITMEWKGTVADVSLQKGAPEVLATPEALEKLWKDWKLAGDPPKIDFDKEIVLVETTFGTKLSVSAQLDDKGDLKVLALASSDFGDGFHYLLASVSREGVKTVNKKELPE
jgi:hypothetical protein